MTKKVLITLAILAAVLLTPRAANAKTICTQSYGQPVVCYEEEEKVLGVHETVEAGITDNPVVLAGGLLSASLGFTYLSRKIKFSSLSIK